MPAKRPPAAMPEDFAVILRRETALLANLHSAGTYCAIPGFGSDKTTKRLKHRIWNLRSSGNFYHRGRNAFQVSDQDLLRALPVVAHLHGFGYVKRVGWQSLPAHPSECSPHTRAKGFLDERLNPRAEKRNPLPAFDAGLIAHLFGLPAEVLLSPYDDVFEEHLAKGGFVEEDFANGVAYLQAQHHITPDIIVSRTDTSDPLEINDDGRQCIPLNKSVTLSVELGSDVAVDVIAVCHGYENNEVHFLTPPDAVGGDLRQSGGLLQIPSKAGQDDTDIDLRFDEPEELDFYLIITEKDLSDLSVWRKDHAELGATTPIDRIASHLGPKDLDRIRSLHLRLGQQRFKIFRKRAVVV